MLKKIQKKRLFKLIGVIALAIFLITFLINVVRKITKSADTFMVEEGTLSYEESAEGYVIRDETVLKGNNLANGISQIIADGTRVAARRSSF